MGMGGSTLFPEVLARTFGGRRAGPTLARRSTPPTPPPSPGSPRPARPSAPCSWPPRSRARRSRPAATSSGPGRRAATRPASPSSPTPAPSSATWPAERGFADVFENRPDIGGRYSALSLFGLVPGAAGRRRRRGPARRRRRRAGRLRAGGRAGQQPRPRAGRRAGRRGTAGRDKLTFVLDPGRRHVRALARAADRRVPGKDGTGVVPVVGEPLGDAEAYGDDRLFVVGCDAADALDEVPEDARGSVAGTAAQLLAAGQPCAWFPVLAEARSLGHTVVVGAGHRAGPARPSASTPSTSPTSPPPRRPPTRCWPRAASTSRRRTSTSSSASCSPATTSPSRPSSTRTSPVATELQAVRVSVARRHRVAVTLGFGPRFLHSTGQLHKGGPRSSVFLQVSATTRRTSRSPAAPSASPPQAGPGRRRPARPPGARPAGRPGVPRRPPRPMRQRRTDAGDLPHACTGVGRR